MRAGIIVWMIHVTLVVSCAPVKTSKPDKSQPSDSLPVSDLPPETGSVSSMTTQPTGRSVDLYAIRAGLTKGFIPPDIDKLPCSFLRQGSPFTIPAVAGGPPLALPGPLQNNYSGVWNGLQELRFKVSAYNRIYHNPGIPDWLLTKPTSRTIEYVIKLYDVVVTNPTQQNCSIAGRKLN